MYRFLPGVITSSLTSFGQHNLFQCCELTEQCCDVLRFLLRIIIQPFGHNHQLIVIYLQGMARADHILNQFFTVKWRTQVNVKNYPLRIRDTFKQARSASYVPGGQAPVNKCVGVFDNSSHFIRIRDIIPGNTFYNIIFYFCIGQQMHLYSRSRINICFKAILIIYT
ncbi:hypothetical protein D3C78_1368280 [compost metagenome]